MAGRVDWEGQCVQIEVLGEWAARGPAAGAQLDRALLRGQVCRSDEAYSGMEQWSIGEGDCQHCQARPTPATPTQCHCHDNGPFWPN